MQTSLARRLGAGVLALGLAAGLSACNAAEAATRPADGTTTSTTSAAPVASEVNMVDVVKKAMEAKTTATIKLTAGTSTVTADVDNRGDKRAVHATLAGTPYGDLEILSVNDDLYAKIGGVDQYAKVPSYLGMGLAGHHSQATGSEGSDGALAGLLGTGRLERTETVDGEQLAAYTLKLDPTKIPGMPAKYGTSSLPVTVWLDSQQRPRKIEAKDVTTDKGKQDLTVTIDWGKDVTIAAPDQSHLMSMQEIMSLLGKMGSQQMGAAASQDGTAA